MAIHIIWGSDRDFKFINKVILYWSILLFLTIVLVQYFLTIIRQNINALSAIKKSRTKYLHK
jgi:hypothetical protein